MIGGFTFGSVAFASHWLAVGALGKIASRATILYSRGSSSAYLTASGEYTILRNK